jgi:putative ABC transport system permease protein
VTAPLSRRTALRRAAFITVGAVAGSQLPATPGYAADASPDPVTLASAPVLGLATGLLAGLYPAWTASRIPPVEALRH